jgi:hypothetical protein
VNDEVLALRVAEALPAELATLAVERLWAALPPARRRAARDRLLAGAAGCWPGLPPWARARRLAELVRAARQGRLRSAAPRSPEAAVAAGVAAYPRSLSTAQAYRIVAACSAPVEMQAGPGRPLGNDSGRYRPGGTMTEHFYEAGEDERDKFVRRQTAAIFERAGAEQLIAAAARHPQFGPRFRGLEGSDGGCTSLLELARGCLLRSGANPRGLDGMRLVMAALAHRSYQGTSDFGVILENVIGKAFLGSYANAPGVTWRKWVGIKSIRDFRATGFYRSGALGELPTVAEHGEVPRMNAPDAAKVTLPAADTRAGTIALSRALVVNDDMQAFVNMASALGEASARSIEAAVFELLLRNSGLGPTQTDGQPFFHSNRANVGPTGAMSLASWDGAAAVMAAQRDLTSGVALGLEPAIWLGPVVLRGEAKKINRSAADPAAIAAGVGFVREVVASPRLTDPTRNYLFADPSLYPSIAVGFLDGRQDPTIDEQGSPRRQEGIEWRCTLDFSVGVLDHRPAVTCAGT